jgi:hypothetical protein
MSVQFIEEVSGDSSLQTFLSGVSLASLKTLEFWRKNDFTIDGSILTEYFLQFG